MRVALLWDALLKAASLKAALLLYCLELIHIYYLAFFVQHLLRALCILIGTFNFYERLLASVISNSGLS